MTNVYKCIPYRDIVDEQDNIPEELEKEKETDPDPGIIEDLTTQLQITDICNQMNNFVEDKENQLDVLYKKLNYSYDEFGERDDFEYRQKRSQNMLKRSKRKEEISLVQEKDKIDILMYIKQKGLMVDKLDFINENNIPITCLSVIIGDIDVGCDEDEDPCIFVFPEYILNAAGDVQSSEEDESLEICIHQIKEIIVDETKYVFLF